MGKWTQTTMVEDGTLIQVENIAMRNISMNESNLLLLLSLLVLLLIAVHTNL